MQCVKAGVEQGPDAGYLAESQVCFTWNWIYLPPEQIADLKGLAAFTDSVFFFFFFTNRILANWR